MSEERELNLNDGNGNEIKNTNIVYDGDEPRDIKEEMERAYLEYSMSVIVSRALPDTRDGLKPVHRRILYAMHQNGLRANAKFRKSAKVVGDVIGKFHPHGDISVYEAMVRMAQDFSLRYPLVNGQGNFGSMDGDSAAAMRYTEAKMTKLAEFMLEDIDKRTVDWKDNYDASEVEPAVLPAKIPNLLMNGVMGIAVGMATNIPPHNLNEICDACIHILKSENSEEITVADLMNFIKGPDFPTGGIVYDKEALLNAYSTGRGSIVMRGVATIEENSKGRSYINISEVPFGVNKKNLIEKVVELITNKKIIGIADIRDESNKEGVRVIIDIKKDGFPKKILNQLYQLTQLQSSFGYNFIGLTERGRQPKLFNLKEFLEEFLAHRKEVIERRTKYELFLAEERAHILEGLVRAIDHIDEIVELIKTSDSKEDAFNKLIARYDFSEKQADAILEMKLHRLSGLERQKIIDELAEKVALIADLKDILANPERVVNIILEDLNFLKENFGDERRTKVMPGKVGEFNPKDTIPDEDVVVVLTKNDYIKRIKANSFRVQKRGGIGITTATKENDEIQELISTSNHSDLLFFSSKGRVFRLPTYEIPETTRIAKGQSIVNLIPLQKDEEVASILDLGKTVNKYLIFLSSHGTVKRLDIEEIKKIRSNGLNVIKIKPEEKLKWVKTTSGNDKIMIVSKDGKAIQFDEGDVRAMGRAAAGVRGIRLKDGDEVVELSVASDDKKYIFIVSEKGLGKISEIEDYRSQSRGGSGSKAMNVTAKTGKLVGGATLSEKDFSESQVLLVTKNGQTIKIPLESMRITGRVTQGVTLTKIRGEDDSITSFSIVEKTEDEEGENNLGENNSEEK